MIKSAQRRAARTTLQERGTGLGPGDHIAMPYYAMLCYARMCGVVFRPPFSSRTDPGATECTDKA